MSTSLGDDALGPRTAPRLLSPSTIARKGAIPTAIFAVAFLTSWLPEPMMLPGGMSASVLFVIAAAATASLVPSATGRLDYHGEMTVSILVGCSLFVLFWSLLSVFDVEEPVRAGRVMLSHIMALMIVFTISRTFTPLRCVVLIECGIFMASLASILSFLAYFNDTLFGIMFVDRDRSYGFFKHPNQFGIALSTIAPVALSMALTWKEWRLVRVAALGAISFGFIASGSKTNLLIFAGVGSMILLWSPFLEASGKKVALTVARNWILGAGVGIGGFVALATFNPRAMLILTKFFSPDEEVASIATRQMLWEFSIKQFLAHPFFGQGAGQMIPIVYQDEAVPHSHNVVLDYMRTLGVPGLLVVTVMLLILIFIFVSTIGLAVREKRARLEDRMFTIGLCLGGMSYIAANMTSDSFGPSTTPIFWVMTYCAIFMRMVLIKSRSTVHRPPRRLTVREAAPAAEQP